MIDEWLDDEYMIGWMDRWINIFMNRWMLNGWINV
jgi:hypothetical protein